MLATARKLDIVNRILSPYPGHTSSLRRLLRSAAVLVALLCIAAPWAHARAAGITASAEQQRAAAEVNRYRQMAGQKTVGLSWALDKAATGHAGYMGHTGEFSHYESKTSSPYYVGRAPYDRALRFGYRNDSISEDILWQWIGSAGQRTYAGVDTSVQWWMGAIYHRFAILSPHTQSIGFGSYRVPGKVLYAMDFGGSYDRTGPKVRWPVPGQSGVDVGGENEYPNPLAPCYGSSAPTQYGYPVSVSWYTGAVKLTSARLVRSSDGRAVAGCALSPQKDQYHSYSTSLSFVPRAKLAYGTRYTVTFKGVHSSDGDLAHGTAFAYSWSFTTEPPPAALSGSSPRSGATGVSLQPSVALYFSRPVRTYTFVAATQSQLGSGAVGVSLARSDGSQIGISFVRPSAQTTTKVVLRPSSALARGTTYVVSFRFLDSWGRPVEGRVSFTATR